MARASKASRASKKSAAKKATAKKSAAKKATAKKSAAKKATAKKATAKKATRSKAEAATKKAAAKAAADKSAAKKGATSRSAPAAEKASPRTGRNKSAFDSKFLQRMRRLLEAERETYERQAAQLRAEADSLVMDLDPGDVQFDEESGEGDTIAVERGRDLALAAKAMEMVEEIDRALAKFQHGTYGICEVSGEPIPQERLEAIPWAREKVEYKVGGFGRR